MTIRTAQKKTLKKLVSAELLHNPFIHIPKIMNSLKKFCIPLFAVQRGIQKPVNRLRWSVLRKQLTAASR